VTILINNQTLDLSIGVGDLMIAADDGYDLGDVTNGRLPKIGTNTLAALKAAWELYRYRLKDLGCESADDFWKAIPEGQTAQFVDEFRERLAGFFSLLRTVLDTMEREVGALLKPSQASGQASGQQPESSE
jgi:hypothetical protein